MNLRSFLHFDKPTDMLLETGYQMAALYRSLDTGKNIGVNAELDEKEFVKHIKVRVDPLGDRNTTLDSDEWVGMMESPLDCKVGDVWDMTSPDSKFQRFRVKSIRDNDIVLERL